MTWKLWKSRRSTSRSARQCRRAVRPGLERLEDRLALTIEWDGGGVGNDWNNPLNWEGDTLPGPNDFVLIGGIGSPFNGITITHGAGTTVVDDITSYANIEVSGGSFDVGSDASFLENFTLTGSGRLLGSGNFYGAFDWFAGTQGPGTTYLHAAMTIGGLAVFADGRTINTTAGGVSFAEIHWVSGSIVGTGAKTLTIEGELVIRGGNDKHLNQLTLRKESGTTIWRDTGDLVLDRGSEFINEEGAVFEAQNDALMDTRIVSAGRFTNHGVFSKTVGMGTTGLGGGGLEFRNFGTLDVQTGTVEVRSGGVLALAGDVIGDGDLRVNGGTLEIRTPLTLTDLRVDAGTLDVRETLLASGLELNGGTLTGVADLVIPSGESLTWTDGTLDGTGQVIVSTDASLDVSGGKHEYAGRPINLSGNGAEVNWTGGTIQARTFPWKAGSTFPGAVSRPSVK